MRLIGLILALVFVGAIIIYTQKSAIVSTPNSPKTVTQQEVLEQAKRATEEMNKVIEEGNKRIEELEKSTQP